MNRLFSVCPWQAFPAKSNNCEETGLNGSTRKHETRLGRLNGDKHSKKEQKHFGIFK
jgi:hypothetical protein